MVILLATKQMGQKGILVSADNSCKIMLRITVRIIPDFEHPEHFEMSQAPRSRPIYNLNSFATRNFRTHISQDCPVLTIEFRYRFPENAAEEIKL